MSILIKGMEMPTEGTVIAVYKIDGKLYATRGLSGRLCPIFPVPPHGDLIGRDELIENCMKEDGFLSELLFRKVSNAPTIIPASESKERPAFLPQYELTPRSEEGET